MTELNLREADSIEATVIIDNYTDLLLLQSTSVMKRAALPISITPLAEHGLSIIINVKAGTEEHIFLMDTGVTPTCLFHNFDVFCINMKKIEGIILSHGHFDHFGGLIAFLGKASKGIDLVLHPEAFLERRLNLPGLEAKAKMPDLDEEALKKTGVILHKTKKASTWFSDLVLSFGEVERVTDFEKGFPWAEAKINGRWVADPFNDDQGIAINVKGKGLVIIGGCSHAGIINTIKHAQKISRINKVHAVLGGFHLSGPIFEPIIGPTIEEMKIINPDYIAPMHCTGWNAMKQFADKMPDKFLLNCVGTTYTF